MWVLIIHFLNLLLITITITSCATKEVLVPIRHQVDNDITHVIECSAHQEQPACQ